MADVDQDGATPVPTVGPGPVEVFEVLGFTDEASRTEPLLASASSDGFVAVLDFSPAHPDAPDRSMWNVAAIAEDRSGQLEFPGRQQHVQDFFDTAGAAFVPDPYGSELELLVGIAREALATFIAGGEPRGPIGTHVARVEEEMAPDPYADWYALPEEQRPLQDGTAPPEVLAAMSTRRVMFDIPADLARDDLFITIRAPQGILSVSALSAGGHFSDVYTPADSTWTVTVEDESGGRLHEHDVRTDVWSALAATQVTLSQVGGAWAVAASPIDGAQMSSILDSWVVEGSPSPEPTG